MFSIPNQEDGEIFSTVGYGKKRLIVLHFTNFGTIKRRPQSFRAARSTSMNNSFYQKCKVFIGVAWSMMPPIQEVEMI
ncbi:hypothetical protein ACEQPO_11230 [Bacillus sp. SL00103]